MTAPLTIAGAGMAGLVAAARARELGLPVAVREKGDRAGGSMLLSSCVVWRHRDFESFRAECPGGDAALQRVVWERLDDALAWLQSLGAEPLGGTGNPRTTGVRFDPRALVDALARRCGEIRLAAAVTAPPGGPLVLATGGFPVELARRFGIGLRANPWSDGDGLRLARALGAAVWGDLDEFYGRNMPAPPARVEERDYVRLAQLYGRHALVVDDAGDPFAPDPILWSETDLVQATARRPHGRAWYVTDAAARNERVRDRVVADMVAAADRAGAVVRVGRTRTELARTLGVALPPSERLAQPPFVAVRVRAAVTHTLGGIRVDGGARVLDGDGRVLEGLYAAGVDAGGVANGGYASGLAQALVLGLAAAESAASP